jgi:hypothetical protein
MKSFHVKFLARALAGVLMLCAGLSGPAHAQIVINEVMASNDSAVQNEGIFPDWVELYNTSSSPIDISDWSLTDSVATPRKFIFPAGTFIGPNGFLVVWLDGLTNLPFHASFTISGTTDDVSLYGAGPFGTQQDTVGFGLQIDDLSVGRVPDGGPAFSINLWTLTSPTPDAPNSAVPLGAVENLKINEIMARPASGDDWFELYNPETNHVRLGGLRFSDQTNAVGGVATNRAITNLSFIAAGDFIQFFADNLDNRDWDHVDFQLGNSGDRIVLFHTNRTTKIDQVDFFFAQTNDVAYGRLPDGSTNLVIFPAGRSTPAASNFQLLMEVVINEVLTHTDDPLEDALELYNPWPTNVNIGNYWISNARNDPKKFRIPAGTTVAAGGYIVFYERGGPGGGFNPDGTGTNRSFTFNSARGDEVYIHSANAAGDLTFFRASRDFGPSDNGVSFGRYLTSDARQELVAMTRRTFGVDNPTSLAQFRTGTGLTNPYPRVGPLVINEIMYHPPDIDTGTNVFLNDDQNEYVEIHNPGTTNVLLYDPVNYGYADGRTNTWRLRGVVDFNFPTNVSLAPGGYLLVVNFNPETNTTQLAAFRNKYAVPMGVQIFGPYSSELDNAGGSVELYRPDAPQAPGRPDALLVPYVRIEKVEYDDRGLWPVETDGQGPALQRVHALGYGNDSTNWIAVTASPGVVFVPNAPPIIDPIANIITNEMRRIFFFVTARDTNVPAQALTFSLANAPVGATIEPNGFFRWGPREEDGENPARVHSVSVRVTDNGSPSLSSTQTFTIAVNEVNRPPNFQIREQWVKANNQLAFLTGADPDIPAQIVTYSIAGTAPAGLSVDSNSGIVTWTPTDAQASPTPYRVTVEAFDDGTPILTNRFTYSINVKGSSDVLVWPSVRIVGPEVVIEWEATVGKSYVIEFTDNLSSANWSEFTAILAENPVMSITDLRFNEKRFYRIVQVD